MPVRFIEEEYPHGFWIEDFQGKPLKVSRSIVCNFLGVKPNKIGTGKRRKSEKKFELIMQFDKLLASSRLSVRAVEGGASEANYYEAPLLRHSSFKKHFCLLVVDEGDNRILEHIERHKNPHAPPFLIKAFTLSDFCGKPLVITKHAIERFVDRWPGQEEGPLENMQQVQDIMQHLAPSSRYSRNSPHLTRRVIDHSSTPSEYFDVGATLRFVVVTDQEAGKRTLVTVERRKGASK